MFRLDTALYLAVVLLLTVMSAADDPPKSIKLFGQTMTPGVRNNEATAIRASPYRSIAPATPNLASSTPYSSLALARHTSLGRQYVQHRQMQLQRQYNQQHQANLNQRPQSMATAALSSTPMTYKSSESPNLAISSRERRPELAVLGRTQRSVILGLPHQHFQINSPKSPYTSTNAQGTTTRQPSTPMTPAIAGNKRLYSHTSDQHPYNDRSVTVGQRTQQPETLELFKKHKAGN